MVSVELSHSAPTAAAKRTPLQLFVVCRINPIYECSNSYLTGHDSYFLFCYDILIDVHFPHISTRLWLLHGSSSSPNHLLGIGLVNMGETAVLGGNEMADEGEGVFQLGYDGIFIVFVGQVVANGDVSTAHADAIECQSEDVAALAGSDGK